MFTVKNKGKKEHESQFVIHTTSEVTFLSQREAFAFEISLDFGQ